MNPKSSGQHPRLEKCLCLPENRVCCECSAKHPQWASTNLGVFMCLRCAGIHRALGTHISKVRSTSMDTWDEDMIRRCECIGNARGRILYEHAMPANTRPTMFTDAVAVERFIREKYERKLYYSPKYEALVEQFYLSGAAGGEWAGAAVPGPAEKTTFKSPPPSSSVPMLWDVSGGNRVAGAGPAKGGAAPKSGVDVDDLFATTAPSPPPQPGKGPHHPHPQPSVGAEDVKREIMSLFSSQPNGHSAHVYSAWQPQRRLSDCYRPQ